MGGAAQAAERILDLVRQLANHLPAGIQARDQFVLARDALALRGVRYRPLGAAALLRRNLLIYGVGGVIAPFIGIKLLDMLMTFMHLV